MIYLDNNSTTKTPQCVIDEVVRWFNRGNPSSTYRSAIMCRMLIKAAQAAIVKLTGANLNEHDIIFNSGTSESSSHVIRGIVARRTNYSGGRLPHIVTTAIEHKSVLKCLSSLEAAGIITVTYVLPDIYGFIRPHDIEAAIGQHTVLVVMMAANNETGAIMDYQAVGEICRARGVPLYIDAAQYFGKYSLDASACDAFSFSLHKLHGPPGVGVLVVRKSLALEPLIYGNQFGGARGGTENVPGIAGALAALRFNFSRRHEKNAHMRSLRARLVDNLSEILPCVDIGEYHRAQTKFPCIVIVGANGMSRNYLPNTLMISIVKPHPPYICNTRIKRALEARGIIISIGSACNSNSKYASHVVDAMHFDTLLKKGVLRISFSDENTCGEIKEFVWALKSILKEMFNE